MHRLSISPGNTGRKAIAAIERVRGMCGTSSIHENGRKSNGHFGNTLLCGRQIGEVPLHRMSTE
jgi:hypothetical protein